MKIYESVASVIGNTPLLRLSGFEKEKQLNAVILGKLEGMNPAGSVKDRVALEMINDAEERGILKPGGTIIEPTSGNTGIGIASIAAARGYRVILTMPDTMSPERIALQKAYGAEIVLTPGKLGMQGAVDKAEEIRKETPGSFITGQFINAANPQAHYKTTGPEIWKDTDGTVDIFVAGIGTGGTITGTGRYLKEKNPAVKVIAVEPADSPILAGGKPGPHGLQGIGANFIPEILDTGIYDEIMHITTEEAYDAARILAKKDGYLAGISAGAALHAAEVLAARPENKGKTIVVLLPDTGTRYLSTKLFS